MPIIAEIAMFPEIGVAVNESKDMGNRHPHFTFGQKAESTLYIIFG